jgi:hypothetical protein
MKFKLTKENFDLILEAAVRSFGYTYVWDQIKGINSELNFDDEDFDDEDSELYWKEDEE